MAVLFVIERGARRVAQLEPHFRGLFVHVRALIKFRGALVLAVGLQDHGGFFVILGGEKHFGHFGLESALARGLAHEDKADVFLAMAV